MKSSTVFFVLTSIGLSTVPSASLPSEALTWDTASRVLSLIVRLLDLKYGMTRFAITAADLDPKDYPLKSQRFPMQILKSSEAQILPQMMAPFMPMFPPPYFMQQPSLPLPSMPTMASFESSIPEPAQSALPNESAEGISYYQLPFYYGKYPPANVKALLSPVKSNPSTSSLLHYLVNLILGDKVTRT